MIRQFDIIRVRKENLSKEELSSTIKLCNDMARIRTRSFEETKDYIIVWQTVTEA